MYLADLKEVTVCKLNSKNYFCTLCETESAELKWKVRASLWAYLKLLDLVSKLEEYLDPTSNLI